ncbi:putative WD domain, G-beta repeat-containing protein [Neospora caninum Liverpool]|uniref:Putative WD domain, G-beta repeat-containing protein n=1 Tax=Neospora caninum (strain Liverpool) TaxID=572307 RepID=F0VNS1_NEOCL|nr:putative WD domain, G-beta repeat-containing protein [Neospora caninum Liverpool]CBZ55367.1 putative WD domain, G-beta repeat-containing protein [Neospora caninum Liverpool]CEL70103.1 TPA: WD domain, G-beta repeat-containing protein,putative [Neospora caninum Liverpool]|eukprot:XP_003885395.1 putative WD domain, G-beta repeat-containing protein [Neospora caninum Liverpool]
MKKKSRKSTESAMESVDWTDAEKCGSATADARGLDSELRNAQKKKRRAGEKERLQDDPNPAPSQHLSLPTETLRSRSPSATSSRASSPSSHLSSQQGTKAAPADDEGPALSDAVSKQVNRKNTSWRVGGGSIVHRASAFLCGGKVLATPRGEDFVAEGHDKAGACTRELCFFSAKTGRLLYVTRGHSDTITSVVALPPNASPHLPSSLALSASLDGSLCLWSVPVHPLLPSSPSSADYLLHRIHVGFSVLSAACAPGSREVFLLVQGEREAQRSASAPRPAPTYAVCTLSLGSVLAPPPKSQLCSALSGASPQFRLHPQILFSLSLPPTAFCVSRSGAFVAVTSGKRLLLFSRQLDRLLPLRHVDRLVQVSIHPTDDFVVAGDRIGRILAFFCLNDLGPFLSLGVDVSARRAVGEPGDAGKGEAPEGKTKKDAKQNSTQRHATSRLLPPPLNLSSSLASGISTDGGAQTSALSASGKKSASSASLSPVILHWHAHAVTALAFSADGMLLLSGGEEGVLVLWHIRQAFHRQFLPRLGAPIFHISSLAPLDANAEGSERVAVSCGDNSVKLVDLVHFQVSKVVQGVDLPLAAFAYASASFSAGHSAIAHARASEGSTQTPAVCAACRAAARGGDALRNGERKPRPDNDGEEEKKPAGNPDRETEPGVCCFCGDKANSTATRASVPSLPSLFSRFEHASSSSVPPIGFAPSPASRGGLVLSPLLPLSLSRARQQAAQQHLAVPTFLRRASAETRRYRDSAEEGVRLAGSVQSKHAARERNWMLLFSSDAARLQVYDAEQDKHVLHLPVRPQRMYTSRVDDAFSASQWEVRFAAADVCGSSLAVVESRGASTAVGEALLGAQGPRGATGDAESSIRRKRIEDAAVADGRCHSITFWVFDAGDKDGKGDEAGTFTVKTRVDDFHVNEVTALQPHTRDPRFFFTLSLDTYFKAWREVVPSSSSSAPSFFACILEGSYRGLAPLSCSLSLDASLLAIAHGGSLITLWKASSFVLSQSLRLPQAATLRSMAAVCAGETRDRATATQTLAKGSDARVEEEAGTEFCDKVALLETAYGLFLVAGTTTCVILYDLLSLNICWVKTFYDDGGIVDFLFVEPGGGMRFSVVLAKLTAPPADEGECLRAETGKASDGERTRGHAKAAVEGDRDTQTVPTSVFPSHELRIFTLSHQPCDSRDTQAEGMTKKKKKSGGERELSEKVELPLLPLLGPLESSGDRREDMEAGHGGSGVYVHCVWQQERKRLGEAILAGCFLPPSSASPLEAAIQNSEESVLMLLNARFQLETIRVPAGAVSPPSSSVGTPQVGDVVDLFEEPGKEGMQTKRKLQQLLQVERAKSRREVEDVSGDSDKKPNTRLGASRVSDVAPLFCQAMAKAKREKTQIHGPFGDRESADLATPAPGVLVQRLLGHAREGESDDEPSEEDADGKALCGQLLAATQDREEEEPGRKKQRRDHSRTAELDRLRGDADDLRARDEQATIKRAPKRLLASLVASMDESADESD